MNSTRKRSLRWKIGAVLIGIAIILALGAVGGLLWALDTPDPMPEALAALESDESVEVTVGDWLVFHPVGALQENGLILYPGGRVDPRSYAPAARAIAERGHLVVIPSMPLNLAVLAPDRAAEVIAAFPEVARWVVGGHSLGGAMAANFVASNPDAVDGLLLWAAYPTESDSQAQRDDLAATSIYATLDGLATVDEIEDSAALLPEATTFVAIEGGNHAQFGWYGDQPGDNPATISREQQQTQIVAATLEALAPAP